MSLTIQGIAALVIVGIISSAGVEVVPTNAEVDGFIKVAGCLVAAAAAFYGRYRKGDINVFGMRR